MSRFTPLSPGSPTKSRKAIHSPSRSPNFKDSKVFANSTQKGSELNKLWGFHKQVSLLPAEANKKFQILQKKAAQTNVKIKESLSNRRLRDIFGINISQKLVSLKNLGQGLPRNGAEEETRSSDLKQTPRIKEPGLQLSSRQGSTVGKQLTLPTDTNKKASQEYFLPVSRGKKTASKGNRTTFYQDTSMSTGKKHKADFEVRKLTLPRTSRSPVPGMPGSERGVGKAKLKIVSAIANGSMVGRPLKASKYDAGDLSESQGSTFQADQVFGIVADLKSILAASAKYN